ncbi:MAG: site-2 protease family protein [Patescibacteria group bacterium]|nr:site-2 protease family protein [Patescibacteria group bacterium]
MTITAIILVVITLIFSIIIHEVSHGLVADHLGDPTARLAGRLTLNPLPHIDPIGSVVIPALSFYFGGFIFGWAKPVPYNPYNLKNPKRDSVLVALAGPASNLILMTIFIVFYHLLPVNLFAFKSFLVFPIEINLILALFNLIPIPPLDGSRIFLNQMPIQTQIFLERYGLILVLAFLLFFGNWFFNFIQLIFRLIGV